MKPEHQFILTNVLVTVLTVVYAMFLHLLKEELNDYLDRKAPKWYPYCVWCRGIHFGVPLGMVIMWLLVRICQ